MKKLTVVYRAANGRRIEREGFAYDFETEDETIQRLETVGMRNGWKLVEWRRK